MNDQPEILKQADLILSGFVKEKDPYEKAGVILKLIPVESFDEAFRFFNEEDRKVLLKHLDRDIQINSIETRLVLEEFIELNDLGRYLKTTTLIPDELIKAFRKYSAKHPRKISDLISECWLKYS